MFRKTPQKQTSFEDAEANDMIHMGSGHRCVMATFMISMLGKNIHTKNKKKQDSIGYDERDQAEKTSVLKCPSSKKRYQEIVDTIKKSRHKRQ